MTRARIEELDRQINELRKVREQELVAMQKACQHPADEILEVGYKPAGMLITATPPFRVCKLCGYAEEGWHCGYWKLHTREEVPKISREKAIRDYVLKFYSQDQLNKERFHADHSTTR